MTLKRLMIVTGILVLLVSIGIAWLWEYAYTPQGRARVIIAQLKRDTTTLRGWMIKHHLVRPGFSEPTQGATTRDAFDVGTTDDMMILNVRRSREGMRQWSFDMSRQIAAEDEMEKLGREVLPIVIEALQDDDYYVKHMARGVCWTAADEMGKLKDKRAAEALEKLGDKRQRASQPATSAAR